MHIYDIVVIGGGIVGISTAWQLKKKFPDADILLVEKEETLAKHQTGHNSGVVHAGVYYKPGSHKADFCKRGALETLAFCQEHNLPILQCGKLLVATEEVEFSRMANLEVRCNQNKIVTHRLNSLELKKEEPEIVGLGALLVPSTGITDFSRISMKMAMLFKKMGGELRLGSGVTWLTERKSAIRVVFGKERVQTRYLIACGGLMADRIAKMIGLDIDFQIMPFRGEYYRLPAHHHTLIKRLIYPIPDPELPFLGVHLTRMIDGSVTVGPNAVLGWKREGYNNLNFDLKDTLDMLTFRGFWKVVPSNLRTGITELRDSLFKGGYLKRVQKYCPILTKKDLLPYPAGVRAQAVKKNGSLIHDFHFAETERSLHVCNAPSPAATSAIPIGSYLVEKIQKKFKL